MRPRSAAPALCAPSSSRSGPRRRTDRAAWRRWRASVDLPAAVGAEQRDDLAGLGRERHRRQGAAPPEVAGHRRLNVSDAEVHSCYALRGDCLVQGGVDPLERGDQLAAAGAVELPDPRHRRDAPPRARSAPRTAARAPLRAAAARPSLPAHWRAAHSRECTGQQDDGRQRQRHVPRPARRVRQRR